MGRKKKEWGFVDLLETKVISIHNEKYLKERSSVHEDSSGYY